MAPQPEAPSHRTQFDVRISEQDSLTTQLRMSDGKPALDAAIALAERYRLPPDQSLLMKVVRLRNASLTKLALEELLELDDRGRVRSNPELIETLKGLKTKDRETNELKELFLQKLGAA
ncbi:MAG: hypothetical protein HC923_03785 [Myxococcales bacterium]|nr:hypothetical protein [Myxococcales bacterium]